jgi:hypothetical protein
LKGTVAEELIESGVDGVLLADRSPASIIAAIQGPLADDTLWESLCLRAYEKWVTHYTAEAFSQRLESALRAHFSHQGVLLDLRRGTG